MELFIGQENEMILMYITSVPQVFSFLHEQIKFMEYKGFHVQGVSSPGEYANEIIVRNNIPMHFITMFRKITPLSDLIALVRLYRLFCKVRPTIVNASTPKAGLLGVLAAKMANVPVIIYTVRGLPVTIATGMKKITLMLTESLACREADMVVAVSHSIRQRAIDMGFVPSSKITVIGSGTTRGVDAAGQFNPQRQSLPSREEIRNQFNLPSDALVIGYLGRIVRDKGIVELEEAWQILKNTFKNLYLLIVGGPESLDPIPPEVWHRLQNDPRVVIRDWLDDPAPAYLALDILILPSYREGFGMTPLEAAAMGVPSVATKIDGLVDSVRDGVTGILVPPRDGQALAGAIQVLLQDSQLRFKMGQMGRERALRDFKPEIIHRGTYDLYAQLIEMKGLTIPKYPSIKEVAIS
jgi:glycosyltransferase involved in cell wall biosynthesis